MMQRIFLAWLVVVLTAPASLMAASLQEAIAAAATENPSIKAAWHAFEASSQGLRAAQGGYYPRVDLNGEIGSERVDNVQGIKSSETASSARLTLTQMLFDGFATRQQVAEQGYIKLARYYEFRQASEQVALEVSRAYLDVVRYRELVSLARDNFAQHQKYYNDIADRVNSGIGRGVDLEQARARLALAESNLLTETTNLHDVSARYHRLVGRFPEGDMQVPAWNFQAIPEDRTEALNTAFINNPELNAAIENIRAADADQRGKNAPYLPRFDLRLRKQVDDNDRGIEGEYDEEAVELVMTYNLYNGGSDRARKRQANYLYYESLDNRERVCREVRQTVVIAHNNIATRTRLIEFLVRNAEAISKAREAYKNQFDIGQRTLLDLLDTENEYFEVRRTLVSAGNDLALAKFETLAGMGLLLQSVDVDRLDSEAESRLDFSREDGLQARCPAEYPAMETLKQKLPDPAPADTEVMRLDVQFEYDSAVLIDPDAADLLSAADLLCREKNISAVIEGHTDSKGTRAYNFKLSRERADTVLNNIVGRCADAKNRLRTVGYGEIRPIDSNDTDAGRANNRRVQLVLPSRSEGYRFK